MKIYGINGRNNITGGQIRRARLRLGWSQSDLAAKLQLEDVIIEQKAVSRIDLGERLVTDYELLALAKVLKVSVMWLLTGEQQ